MNPVLLDSTMEGHLTIPCLNFQSTLLTLENDSKFMNIINLKTVSW